MAHLLLIFTIFLHLYSITYYDSGFWPRLPNVEHAIENLSIIQFATLSCKTIDLCGKNQATYEEKNQHSIRYYEYSRASRQGETHHRMVIAQQLLSPAQPFHRCYRGNNGHDIWTLRLLIEGNSLLPALFSFNKSHLCLTVRTAIVKGRQTRGWTVYARWSSLYGIRKEKSFKRFL